MENLDFVKGFILEKAVPNDSGFPPSWFQSLFETFFPLTLGDFSGLNCSMM